MSSFFDSKKPIKRPAHPTWALLEPGNLPNFAFAGRALGSIVPHSAILQPTSSYFLPVKLETLDNAFKELEISRDRVEDSGAKTFIDSQDNKELQGKLGRILDLRTHSTDTSNLTIETQTVCTRTFLNSPVLFEELKKDADTLKRLNKILDDEGVADMVVGLKTCIDADLKFSLSSKSGTNLGATIPVNEIIVALGSPPVPIDLSLGAEVNLERIRKYVQEHQAKGERVFALQYQRIMRVKRWRKQKEIEMPGLEVFEHGLYDLGDGDDDYDDDDLILCPAGEFPAQATTM
jgi:hypothetical protein